MSSGKLRGLLAPALLVAAVGYAAGCREDAERATAQPPPPPIEAAAQEDEGRRASPSLPVARGDAPPAPVPTATPAPAPPTATPEAAPGRKVRGRWEVGAPWRLGLADVPGRGVRVEHIEIRSIALPLIEAGDVIIGVDERQVTSSDQLERYLRAVAPGALVVFAVRRGDDLHYVMLDVPDAETSP